MSRCLRYQNPVIYNHLAQQYVAGVMTLPVRLRTEALMQQTPELERAAATLADDFAEVHLRLPERHTDSATLDGLWENIDRATTPSGDEIHSGSTESGLKYFWDSLLVWKAASGIGAMASLVLAVALFVGSSHDCPIQTGPSYLANMSAANDQSQDIQFVISAYAKQDDTPSRLHIQWSKAHAGKKKHPPLHLWAEDKDTLELTYIGLQPAKGEQWDLTKPTWQAVANSRRLFMTADNQQPSTLNTIFSGLCLQLKEWKS